MLARRSFLVPTMIASIALGAAAAQDFRGKTAVFVVNEYGRGQIYIALSGNIYYCPQASVNGQVSGIARGFTFRLGRTTRTAEKG